VNNPLELLLPLLSTLFFRVLVSRTVLLGFFFIKCGISFFLGEESDCERERDEANELVRVIISGSVCALSSRSLLPYILVEVVV
jgi:hypothetical protein